jgi:hypothetical protein
MTEELPAWMLGLARSLQAAVDATWRPPIEVARPQQQPVLPHTLFIRSRGYLEKIAFQVNACYIAGAYDGCAVMIRRLVEVLIIEAFEAKGFAGKIRDTAGDYLMLGELVPLTLRETTWTLSRTTKRALSKLKEIGDLSAHSRMYNAQRPYIDEIIGDLRVVSEELLYLAGLR